MKLNSFKKKFKSEGWVFGLILGFLVSSPVLATLNIAQTPLFLSQSAKPIVLFNISNDHQLYFKAFDDYSDLNGDGLPETSYLHSFVYYGYFDSEKCYTYSTSDNRFNPNSITADRYCTNKWSGNFLNWASMARLDTIRKMLYGGFRSTDTAALTVLERTFIPTDAHSFAKFYDDGVGGTELVRLTPFTMTEVANGITLCNTTVSDSGVNLSQNVTSPPLIRVAQGNFLLWASHERYQCQWRGSANVSTGTQNTSNGNNAALSGISASNQYPSIGSDRLGGRDFIARVKVCASVALQGQEECTTYGSSIKPTGLLQKFGDLDQIRFGLMTGSYGKNVSGGVLRKNISTFTDEVDPADGTFISPLPTDSIVNTLNSFRIYGYQYRDGNYFRDSGSDQCSFNVSNLTDATDNGGNTLGCSNWGNPQSEIYLESLRYLAGFSASTTFDTDDTSFINNLTTATAVDPIASNQWCAAINVIQFNASVSSYDSDELSDVSDIGITDLNSVTDAIGTAEGIDGNIFFVGENGTNNNQLCTAKLVSNLSSVRGTCPDAPRLQSSYHIAGLAHYAHTNDLRPPSLPSGQGRQDNQLVTTYGVALTPSLPKVNIPIPTPGSGIITILPACQNTRENTNCSIVDYKIVSQDHTSDPATGRLYVNWETGEQGGDFDQDMWGILDYSVTSTQVTITTDVFNESTGAGMAFGYVINGTTQDSFHAHTGINGYSYTDPFPGVLGCNNCSDGSGAGQAATTVTYTIGSTVGASLEQPLFYAAKYGGFIDSDGDGLPNLQSEWDSKPVNNPDGLPDRYFFAINPKTIADGLNQALLTVLQESSASATVAASAARIGTGAVVYQAIFKNDFWTSTLEAFQIFTGGNILSTREWEASALLTAKGLLGARSIFGFNSATQSGVVFNHANLSPVQQTLITDKQVDYLKGDDSEEEKNNGALRDRDNGHLGDIVNSAPKFIGKTDFGFHKIPPVNGAEPSSYTTYLNSSAYKNRRDLIAVGANDGMLHVFDATIMQANSGEEVFAFVPDETLKTIASYTNPIYIAPGQHKYFVDGSPTVGDAYIDPYLFGKQWRTVLIGTTGVGGKSIFALDVSFIDPAGGAIETAFLPQRVLWEINTTTAPSPTDLTDQIGGPVSSHRHGFANYLGLTRGEASIVRMNNGKFAAVFGNGYNSVKEEAVLYIVDIETGNLIKSIATGAGNPSLSNGLAAPFTVDRDGDRIVDAIYAGDLLGNIWKFDVSSGNPDNWKIGFGDPLAAIPTPQPLYIAKDTSNVVQPITAKVHVGKHPRGGVMVYFGTGKYFLVGDNIVGANPQTQTFYGIRDNCVSTSVKFITNCSTTSVVNDRTDLVEQTIIEEATISTNSSGAATSTSFDVRQTSSNPVDFSTKKGWYIDLRDRPYPGGTAVGEVVVNFPKLRNGRIIFVTFIPSIVKCSTGGSSWIMEMEALTGQKPFTPPIDITGDGKIDSNDLILIHDANNDSSLTKGSEQSTTTGYKIVGGDTGGDITILGDTVNTDVKIKSIKDGGFVTYIEDTNGKKGRLSWKQFK